MLVRKIPLNIPYPHSPAAGNPTSLSLPIPCKIIKGIKKAKTLELSGPWRSDTYQVTARAGAAGV